MSFEVILGGEGSLGQNAPRPAVGEGETKIASRPAKVTIFVRNIDVAKIIEKGKENQRFWLP